MDERKNTPSQSPSAAVDSLYSRPRPRLPKSPAHSAKVRIQNRRREYLERNPGYFASGDHELADPVLYDALIRRFQSAEEREREGRSSKGGYGRALEAGLLRGEAKLTHAQNAAEAAEAARERGARAAAVADDEDEEEEEEEDDDDDDDVDMDLSTDAATKGSGNGNSGEEGGLLDRDSLTVGVSDPTGGGIIGDSMTTTTSEGEKYIQHSLPGYQQHHHQGNGGTVGGVEAGTGNNSNSSPAATATKRRRAIPTHQQPRSRAEGRRLWDEFLRRRFVLGGDDDFDYRAADEDDELDALERRDLEEAWFEDEDPGWVGGSSEDEEGEEEEEGAEERDGDGQGDGDGDADGKAGGEGTEGVGGGGVGGSNDDKGRRRAKKKEKRRERMLEGETGVQDY